MFSWQSFLLCEKGYRNISRCDTLFPQNRYNLLAVVGLLVFGLVIVLIGAVVSLIAGVIGSFVGVLVLHLYHLFSALFLTEKRYIYTFTLTKNACIFLKICLLNYLIQLCYDYYNIAGIHLKNF